MPRDAALQSIIDSLRTPVFAIDHGYRYLAFNAAHAGVMLAAYGREPALGDCILDHMTHVPGDADLARANADRALAGETVEVVEEVGQGERARVFDIVHAPVVCDGRIIGASVSARDITDREHAARQLEASERKLRLAIASGNRGMFEYDVGGNQLSVDEGFARIHGDPGRTAYTFDELWERGHADDLARTSPLVEACVTGETERYETQYRIRHADGTWRWLFVTGTCLARDDQGIGTHVVGIVLDITERVELEERVRESEARTRAALEAVQAGEWEVDLHDRSATRSPRHAAIFGQSADDRAWSLDRFLDRVVDSDRARVAAIVGDSMENMTTFGFECRIVRADDEVRWIQVRGVPHRPDGEHPGWLVGTVVDITDRKAAEEELREVNRFLELRVEERSTDLAEALVLLKHAQSARNDFMRATSHELRTPLNQILGFTGVVLSEAPGALNDEQRFQLEMASDAAHKLLSLVNDLLDVLAIDTGQVRLEHRDLEAAEVIDHAARATHSEAVRLARTLSWDGTGAGVHMHSDPARLEQILVSLIGSALRASDSGARVACFRDSSSVAFEVAWSGSVPGGDLSDDVFGRFFAEPVEGETRDPGIGLYVAKRLARLLGGDIVLAHRADGDTAFTLTVPARAPDRPA